MICFNPHEFIGQVIYDVGNFDRKTVDDMLRYLHEKKIISESGSVLLEVGANIGTQTVYFCKSRFVDRVLAVEPDPRNLDYLQRNIEWNDLQGMVTVVPCAIGEVSGHAKLYRSPTNYGGSSLFQTRNGDAVTVEIKTLDQILKTAGIDEDQISLIWMDIEGAEPMACRSMIGLLSRKVPFMMEFSPSFYGSEQTHEFVAFLSRYYDRCLVYEEEMVEEIRVKDLPVDREQVNILLLP